tara:strand:- start:1413 stop:1667 length:255 start_codon:yes stop_codon:yes gene_type:complete
MQTEKYYVIKPTTHSRKKVSYGDELALTESQARPLRNGGFVSPDKAAAQRIAELVKENQTLQAKSDQESEAQTEADNAVKSEAK